MKKINFKQTEIGEIPEGWEELSLSEAIEVDPKRELKKGTQAKFVSMADLRGFDKKIQGFITREFSGGSKFVNEDALMARITPCLENGKTAFVDILEKQEVGCGSTEFIVLAAKKNKTIPEFVYYLAISPEIRAQAIQSMTGTSGRQRVEPDIFDKIIINLPDIAEQRAIAKILSDLDEKIELNHQMNKTLESIAQALFKRWFVDFEFPGYEKTKFLNGLPKGWRSGNLGEIINNFDSRRIPLSSRERDQRKGECPYYGAASVVDYLDDYIFDGIYVLMGEDGTVVTDQGLPTLQYVWGKFWVNNHAHVLQGKGDIPTEYILLLLQQTNVQHIVTGAVQPKINQNNMNNLSAIIPEGKILTKFNQVIKPIYETFRNNVEETRLLTQIRDSLLPKLVSGKIRVDSK